MLYGYIMHKYECDIVINNLLLHETEGLALAWSSVK